MMQFQETNGEQLAAGAIANQMFIDSYLYKTTIDPRRAREQLEGMRPSAAVFLGGTGQLMGSQLKALLTARYGNEWKEKIRLLAFDTTEEPFAVQLDDGLVRLEPGSEFFNIGSVPVPSIIRHVERHAAIRDRLGASINILPPVAMRNGAKQIRPLGLLAFLWNYQTVLTELRKTIWGLAGRDMHEAVAAMQQQGINIFVAGSLVGGTCSGTFLDTTCLIRSLFDELGTQGEFCHITGIGVLPQAFQGIPGTNLLPNTAAALKELNYLMVHGGFQTRYPDGRKVDIRESPFNLFYVLDGVDERGQTWSGLNEVAAMAAEGIFLQMCSQLGRKGDNAFDNVTETLIGQTNEGDGTFLASFGLGYLEFPAPAVAGLLAHWLLADLIESEWLQPGGPNQAADEATGLLQGVTLSQLAPVLMHDPATGGELRLDLRQPGWLHNKRHDEIAAEAAGHVREYGLARVNEGLLGQINRNSAAQSARQCRLWTDWANDNLFAPGQSLHRLQAVLTRGRAQLTAWRADAQARLSELNGVLERQTLALTQLEPVMAQAAGGFPVGRGGRIRGAVGRYFQAAREMFESQIQQGLVRGQLRVWGDLEVYLAELDRLVETLADRLETLAAQARAMGDRRLWSLQMAGVSHLSLADEAYVRLLYRRYRPERVALMSLPVFEGIPALELARLGSEPLNRRLLVALGELFAPVAAMSVETVIEERASEMTPRARRQQLFHLATPAWNIDRARLPEGGADLVRLEVLGVPDEANTLFDEETIRVSTHDPYRLVALVVAAGAPQSALQQHELYQQALEKVRGYRPLHILPQFVADANQARLAFALGLIFNLVYNQGTYFYYQPADPLENPLRLGNGLANALHALEVQESLVREVLERIEGEIAQSGVQRTIERLAGYYDSVPDGRTPLDELARELKRVVRDYAEELRQINEWSAPVRVRQDGRL